MMVELAWVALALALLPLGMCLVNMALYRAPPLRTVPNAAVSILIPARNEESSIAGAVLAALAQPGVELEVIVLDDHSTDNTAAIVRGLAARDPRVRLAAAPPLPPGWSGKQHACHVLGTLARHPVLLFQDADVRLEPNALGRMVAYLRDSGAGLVSGFPRQVTGTLGEALVIPMIHVLLLGYLPMLGMRFSAHPGFGAACGQLMLVDRDAYAEAGGHAAIRTSLHDGVTLPRAFRRAGHRTDLFDATGLARCRMYQGFGQVWAGFSKNATEGMATPAALPVWTVLLFGGHVLPWLLLALSPGWVPALAAGVGVALRLLLAVRYHQSLVGALLHPVGVLVMLAIQWTALVRSAFGRPSVWRGRAYPTSPLPGSDG
ncbi:glycosyltransferase [Azospirillum rugosum]|uniref:Cellulose synthase/poly-beta-1,6-N-acetylglucosamine synthase-like glycosyltransferase n=1 Tax=Azospirillum rugosum TaxID=416170 RepID=A0ABS4SHG9_9PROT|nr:glycosyltransferase family 2 protein [Azospirillum rugosum]MBP2292020.1 cellulose synthase/poly-beta-1,6-N-acetylglucosamine synthase-like glycosyltransferase [Azospirillum rugosum]MDQ0525844.1 cellulose synthase/poly-beta-1,6-N-acetylglucosamine synthase-like glycosyltransferase [Azospirillum rugosum]